MCYRPHRGEGNQHRHLKWQLDGNQHHGVVLVLVLRRYSVVCWTAQQHPVTSPITWTHRALNRLLGNGQPRLRWPGLPSNSTMQVINILIVPVTTSRNMNVISLDIFFKLVISYLFESIRLNFFESIRLLLL